MTWLNFVSEDVSVAVNLDAVRHAETIADKITVRYPDGTLYEWAEVCGASIDAEPNTAKEVESYNESTL